MHRMLLVIVIAVIAAGCSPRGTITYDPAARDVGIDKRIWVATTRALDPATGYYGNERARQVSYSRFDISIPPDRKPGQITWPRKGRPADPSRDFVTTDIGYFKSADAFRAELAQRFRQKPKGQRTATIFVHGFNNTFAEGLYRLAQLSNDLKVPDEVVHYSWPSAGEPLGYIYDRDSTMVARDGFEQLLDQVIAAGADDVVLACHSMGCQLMMESMRQISIRTPSRLSREVSSVVMLSPDIDVSVFYSEARAIKELPDPFFIFSSQKDKALRLSSFITGQPDRLGNITDLRPIADLKVTVLDTSNYSVGSGHLNVGESPALIALLDQVRQAETSFDQDRAGRPGLLPGAVLTAQRATEIVVAPISSIQRAVEN